MTVTIVGSPHCNLHDMGDEHPEQPARMHKINDQIIASGLEYVLDFADAKPVQLLSLERAHDKAFVQSVFERAPKEAGDKVWIDDDTIMMDKSLNAALHAAGAVTDAVDLVIADKSSSAFCSVRPPGHHAGRANSSGFCIFNNVAVGAMHALEEHGLERIAIVDFDVHHGNGTEQIVAGDQRIMLCSSFQHPFYPHSGSPVSASNILSVPLEAGSTGEVFREKVQHWFNALRNFQPELIFISAGFDAHAEDPMAHLRLVEDDYFWISQQLRAVADECCHGRIVSMLEGGYDLSALGRSVVSHLKGMSRPIEETQ